jgi:hypothetical protein
LKRIIFAKAGREGTEDARDQRLGRRRRPEIPGCTAAKKSALRVRKRTEASATVGHIWADAAAQALPCQDPAMREFIR